MTPAARSGGVTTVLLVNDPLNPRFTRGQRVAVADRWIGDWSYDKAGVKQGGYTLRVMLDHLPPEQAAGYREAYGW